MLVGIDKREQCRYDARMPTTYRLRIALDGDPQLSDRHGMLEPTDAQLASLDPIYDLLETLRQTGSIRDYWLGEVITRNGRHSAVFTVECYER